MLMGPLRDIRYLTSRSHATLKDACKIMISRWCGTLWLDSLGLAEDPSPFWLMQVHEYFRDFKNFIHEVMGISLLIQMDTLGSCDLKVTFLRGNHFKHVTYLKSATYRSHDHSHDLPCATFTPYLCE